MITPQLRHLYRHSKPHRVNSPELRRHLSGIIAICYQKPRATNLIVSDTASI